MITRNTLALMAMTLSVSAMADTSPVTLTSSEMTLNNNDVTLIRTAQTPKKIRLNVEVPVGSSVCTQYGQELVYGQDPSCGYDSIFDHYESVCVAWQNTPPPYNPGPGHGDDHGPGPGHGDDHGPQQGPGRGDDHGPQQGPGRGDDHGGGNGPGHNGPRPRVEMEAQNSTCIRYESRPVYRNVMRACNHYETRCIATGISTEHVSKKVAIIFKNANLSGSETETYQLSLDQKRIDSNSVNYQLQSTSVQAPVKISYWNFLWHTITVK